MKEIIIDGVDVARCKHYDIDYNYCDQSYLGEGGKLRNTKNPKRCEQSPNCYYKQLKRLEQERNEWKKKYENVANENLNEIYALIKKNDVWQGIVNVVNGKLEQENAELKKNDCEQCKHLDLYIKYKQTLQRL